MFKYTNVLNDRAGDQQKEQVGIASIEDSDQPSHLCRGIRGFDGCSMGIKGSNISSDRASDFFQDWWAEVTNGAKNGGLFSEMMGPKISN